VVEPFEAREGSGKGRLGRGGPVGWLTKGPAEIGPNEAHEALVAGSADLVDVREQFEFVAGHAPGARHLPLGEIGLQLGTLDHGRRLILVCRSGQRSATATAQLTAAGFDAINLEGGMQAWAAAGLPVRSPEGGPGAVV
jgi:rhodanese-related sulfurtransferase